MPEEPAALVVAVVVAVPVVVEALRVADDMVVFRLKLVTLLAETVLAMVAFFEVGAAVMVEFSPDETVEACGCPPTIANGPEKLTKPSASISKA